MFFKMSWRFATVIWRLWHTSITHSIAKWPWEHTNSFFFFSFFSHSLLLSLTLFPIYSCNHITGNSLILNLVVCPCILVKPIPLKQIFLKLTPRGMRDKVVLAPVHDGFVGGDAANVLPAVIHWMGQAVTLILRGDWPESKMGLGIEGSEDGSGRWTCSVLGSMAHCHSPVASNSRSTARGCCAFWARTFWLLGTFERKRMRGTLITLIGKKNLLSNAKLKGPRCTAIDPFGRFSYQENAFQKKVSLQLLLPLPPHTYAPVTILAGKLRTNWVVPAETGIAKSLFPEGWTAFSDPPLMEMVPPTTQPGIRT